VARFIKLAQSAVLLACTGGGAIAFPTITAAQIATDIPITGGNVVFGDTQIFAPTDSTIEGRAIVHEGGVPDSFLIRTSQGDIPLNAVIRGSTLPTLNVTAGAAPAVGDTGGMLGTLTFRGFSASGEPALFTDIPVELQFQVNAITLGASAPYTQYRTITGILSETGTVDTPTTSADVTRDTLVTFVQFQPEGTPAQDIGGALASEFDAAVIPGVNYNPADFSADLTGGSVTVPVPPGFGQAGSTGGDNGGTPEIFSPSSVFIAFFFSSETDFTIFNPGEMGDFQGTPVMPGATLVGIFIFTSVPSGVWVDPPMVVSQVQTTFGFDFIMTPRPVPVGVASRVFPGMVGVGAASDATFTAITGFPEGIDTDDRYTVSVGDVVVGEFSPGDTVRFSDYQEALGDRLVDGEGVTQFQISGIEPGVDASDPTAFPVRLEYSTPTASFEMRASTPAVLAATAVPAGSDRVTAATSNVEPTAELTGAPTDTAQVNVSTQN